LKFGGRFGVAAVFALLCTVVLAAPAGQAAPAGPGLRLAPVTQRSWQGINDTGWTPPDESGAVGTTRFVELVNSRFAIYEKTKTSTKPIGGGTLNRLVGAPSEASVFDPQVIWDPTTNRFYYAADVVLAGDQGPAYFLDYGFSKGASPNRAAGFCRYSENFGRSDFPDFPKLGDSRDFMIIGFTSFTRQGGPLIGSKLMAVSQPPSGSTCPGRAPDGRPRGLKVGISGQLFMGDGFTPAYTPVPANEIDTSADGWAVTGQIALPGTRLALFKVTRGDTGDPVFQTTGTDVTVPSYRLPAKAPQKGSKNRIDTGQGRLTNAVAAIDPTRNRAFAIWTQHTTSGGSGAEVRWYEIDPATAAILQEGTVASRSLYIFNAAISPNRQVDASTRSGGGSMVLSFNTSSATSFPSIAMVSKVGRGAQSGRVAVFNGTKPLSGEECAPPATRTNCRWGDYAAASPNPSAPNRIWNVNQYAVGSGSGITGPSTGRTLNFIASP
jgi:hypothetical protein